MRFPPTFIMSLDCEGKWGMADHLQPYHHRDLAAGRLADSYRQLLGILARHEIAATFAFVMAFTLSKEERRRFPVLKRRDPADDWLGHYWRSLDAGLGDGWHVPEALDLVRAAGRHEVASHSFCHRPLGERSIDARGAAEELALAAEAARMKGVDLKTLVFPRNEVGHLAAVRSAGYAGYRSRLDRAGGKMGRAAALADEFSIFAAPQPAADPAMGLVAIPSGRFFNWRFGVRRLVPPSVTKARWRRLLERCARDGGVAHLWLHPHNLITGPGTAQVLEEVLSIVARLRDQGRIQVLTQRDYCELVAGQST